MDGIAIGAVIGFATGVLLERVVLPFIVRFVPDRRYR
jgi:hypothetical protein